MPAGGGGAGLAERVGRGSKAVPGGCLARRRATPPNPTPRLPPARPTFADGCCPLPQLGGSQGCRAGRLADAALAIGLALCCRWRRRRSWACCQRCRLLLRLLIQQQQINHPTVQLAQAAHHPAEHGAGLQAGRQAGRQASRQAGGVEAERLLSRLLACSRPGPHAGSSTHPVPGPTLRLAGAGKTSMLMGSAAASGNTTSNSSW